MMEIIISTFFMSLLVVQVLQFLLQYNKLLIYCLGPGRGDYSKSFHIAPPTTRILTTDQRGLYNCQTCQYQLNLGEFIDPLDTL